MNLDRRTFLALMLLSAVPAVPTWAQPLVSPLADADGPVPAGSKPHSHVVVVGGGIAGLVTAFELEKKGFATTVLESADRLGGRIGTAHYPGGLEGEFGMQEIWEKSPLVDIVKELGLELEATDDAWSSLIIDGKLYPFVQDTREAFFKTLFTPAEHEVFNRSIKALEALYREATTQGMASAGIRKLQEMSFDDWLKARKLPHKVERALRLTIEVELASTPEFFSALSAILEWRTFLFGGEKNFHARGGNARIIETLAQRIQGSKMLDARVTHVTQRQVNGHTESEIAYIQHDELHTMVADAVVVAVPWVQMHLIQFQPALSPVQLKAINDLGRGQYTVVHMEMDRAAEKLWKIGEATPFPILSEGPLGVIYGPPYIKTETPTLLFGLLVFGPDAQAYHMAPRDKKRRQILAELDKLFPGFSQHVTRTEFYSYHPAAVAYWPTGHSPLDSGSEALRKPRPGLFLAGDWLESSHSEGAVRSALQVTGEVAAFLGSGAPA